MNLDTQILHSGVAHFLPLPLLLAAGACGAPSVAPTPVVEALDSVETILLAADVEWQHLNPARGDAGPAAATLWGDRNGTEATGFLVRFVDGFESPPHIHNVSYRGVVIEGLVHNDDPNAEEMWMSAGSFWTQPRGGSHITSASGSSTIAYIEIEEGPYLVQPVDEAFDCGERPVNVDASNIVWLNPASLGGAGQSGAVQMSFLWGQPGGPGASGVMVRLAAGRSGIVTGHGSPFRAVFVVGDSLQLPSQSADLQPGSYFESTGDGTRLECGGASDCLVYVRAEGAFEVVEAP